jgi:hypothetical protein
MRAIRLRHLPRARRRKSMDRIIQDGEKLGPKDRAERVALFRVQVIGPLLARDFQDHGELADEIRALAAKSDGSTRPRRSSAGTTSTSAAGSMRSGRGGGRTWATPAS